MRFPMFPGHQAVRGERTATTVPSSISSTYTNFFEGFRISSCDRGSRTIDAIGFWFKTLDSRKLRMRNILDEPPNNRTKCCSESREFLLRSKLEFS